MGFLDHFERSLERVVGGAFAKTFRSGVHPVEVLSALKREMDARAVIVKRGRVLVPSHYTVTVSGADEARMSAVGASLIEEILTELDAHRRTQGYRATDSLSMEWAIGSELPEGVMEVKALIDPSPVVWVPSLLIDGQRYPLTQRRTVIGRGTEADITVTARGLSRRHCEIVWDGKRAEVQDLQSTNGTFLDGAPVSRAALPEECTLTVGEARIVCEVIPLRSDHYQRLVAGTTLQEDSR